MTAASDPREIGRHDAQRLRAVDGLPTPPTDPVVLRALADVLDREPDTANKITTTKS